MDGIFCSISLYIFFTHLACIIYHLLHIQQLFLIFVSSSRVNVSFLTLRCRGSKNKAGKKLQMLVLDLLLVGLFSLFGVSTFACVDLTTVWSIAHTSSAFFQF